MLRIGATARCERKFGLLSWSREIRTRDRRRPGCLIIVKRRFWTALFVRPPNELICRDPVLFEVFRQGRFDLQFAALLWRFFICHGDGVEGKDV